jgi:hypothetical protein
MRRPPRCRFTDRFSKLLCGVYGTLLVAFLISFSARLALAEELLPATTPIETAIDHYVDAALQRASAVAAPRADDGTLLRRTTLDLAGRIPTMFEAKTYGKETDPAKRTALVDRLLKDASYARHQANAFDAMLMLDSRSSLREYLTAAFGENRPWNEMFREMLIGLAGDAEQKGAIQYVRSRVKDLDELTVKTSVDFFGVNISCAKCHDHPEAPDWTQERYYGMKSFFARTFENGGFVGEREYGSLNYKTTDGESHDAQLMFLTGEIITEPDSKEPSDEQKKQEKKLLEELKKEKKAPAMPKESRRAKLVGAAFSEQGEGYFSRSIVNHIWARLNGFGLVNPIDQMHPENPASHPELLEWLARDVRTHNYDLRRLIRGIVLSETYARSSVWDSQSKRPRRDLFAVGEIRPLAPAQYATSLRLAASSPARFGKDVSEDERKDRIAQVEQQSQGFASKLEHPGPEFQVGVGEALLFSNGDQFSREHLNDGDTLVGALSKLEDDNELVSQLIWAVHGRAPRTAETEAIVGFLAERKDRRKDACRQLVWALLTGSEMRFNY